MRSLVGKDTAERLLADEAYRQAFIEAWRTRTVHPSIESLVWQLAHGRPRQAVEVAVDASVRAAPLEIRDSAGELLDLVVAGVGSFTRRGESFDFQPAEPAGLLNAKDDDDA